MGRLSQQTIYNVNADKLHQFAGSGIDYIPTYAATITVDGGLSTRVKIVTTSGVGNSTLSMLNGGKPGQKLTVQIDNDSGGARTITFGTSFRSTGTVVGTASKSILVLFESDGTNFLEIARTSAALT